MRAQTALALLLLAACTTTGDTPTTAASDSDASRAASPGALAGPPTPAVNIVPPDFEMSAGDYWTADRMKNATPADIAAEPSATAAFGAGAAESDPQVSLAVPGSTPPEGFALSSSGPMRAGREHPFSATGKLFYTVEGKDYVCSAQFVGANLILTAAHCVMGTSGAWAQNMVLRRGYSGGQYLDTNVAKCQTAYREAAQGNTYNWPYDYAFVKTTSPSRGGWLGLQTYTGSNSWTAVGYPSNYENGERLLRIAGHRGSSGSVIEMVGNSFGPGSSGGAWIEGLFGPNFVVGLNSFTYEGRPNMWGPLFDNTFWRLYQAAQTAC